VGGQDDQCTQQDPQVDSRSTSAVESKRKSCLWHVTASRMLAQGTSREALTPLGGVAIMTLNKYKVSKRLGVSVRTLGL